MTAEPRILHRDEALVVIDKPSGMLVHRGWDNDPVVAMTWARDVLGQRVYPVHRLDRPTSGVLVFALSSANAKALAGAFKNGEVHKRYLALVRGIPPESGLIDHPIQRRADGPRVPAQTRFERIHSIDHFSLVAAEPLTGRPHQIRRHLKHINHPLIGDVNFGKGDLNRMFRERHGLFRLALHALEISFSHPITGERFEACAPLSADLRDPLLSLGIPAALL